MNHTTLPINWEAVYNEQLPRIFNFFLYRVGDEPLAEDLTAATFEKAWKHRERYRRDLGAFSTWLFSIARNVATDHFRQQRPEVELDEAHTPAIGRPVEEAIQQEGEFARLFTLLTDLEARERELVALKYGAGLTNRAIADLTGLSESNVGTILHRVVTRLRAEWEVHVQ
jgi:RNA polymerase sigma-70 factor (ECF subfamily)